MDHCPVCTGTLRDAVVVCFYCGEELPLRVVVVSEGSHGGGFAIVTEEQDMAKEQGTRRATSDDE
ncbi:MAG: hypothetical protein ACE5OS_12885 [Anaerolineae bacterium]